MRILMLSPHPEVRGPIPKHTPVLVDALVSLGSEIVMEPWGRHRDRESVADKFATRAMDIRRVVRRLKTESFDVMVVKTSHEQRSMLRDLPLLLATRRLVPKIVLQFHGGHSELLVSKGSRGFKVASAVLFTLCDGVLVLSSEEARESQLFWPRGRFRVVMNPFVEPADEQITRRHADNSDGAPLSLLFVGRLITEKGIFETIEAFAQLPQRPRCGLVIVGDGPSSADVAKRVEDLGLSDAVTLKGYLTGQPLREIYRTADVLVFPTYHPEGFPTVITEASCAGLPLITTKTRGTADHLTDANALFVPPRDIHALGAAMRQLISDGALRRQMSEANLANVAKFAPEPVAAQYLEALTSIVEREPAEPVSVRTKTVSVFGAAVRGRG